MRTRSSGYKIAYDVRPSKQAERYIMVELLHKLDSCTRGISEYHYVGTGLFSSMIFGYFTIFSGLEGLPASKVTNPSRPDVNITNPTMKSRL